MTGCGKRFGAVAGARSALGGTRGAAHDHSGRWPGHGADLGTGSWRRTALFVDQESHQLLRALRSREKFGRGHQAHPALQAAQQASAERADRGGQAGPATEPRAGLGLRPGKTEGQREPSDPRGGAQAGGLPACRRSAPKRISNSRKRKPHRRVARCRKYQDLLSALPARSRQLPTGRRSVSSRGPHRIVSRLAGDHELNLLCRPSGPRQQMDVWFSIKEEPPPRGAKASWRKLKTFGSAPPERVGRAFALLTRTYHGCRQPLPNRVTSELPVNREQSRSLPICRLERSRPAADATRAMLLTSCCKV